MTFFCRESSRNQGIRLHYPTYSPFRKAVTTLCCLLVLCVSVAVLFGVLHVEFSRASDSSVGATWSVSFVSDKLNLFRDAELRAGISLMVLVIFSLILACLPVSVAVMALVFSAALMVVVFQLVPGLKAQPSLSGFLITAFAVFACYLFCQLIQRWQHQRKVNQLVRNYVPSNLTDYYRQHPSDIDAISESRELTILFCDIKRFTGISETLEPDSLRDWLNAYFNVVSEVIHQHGGTVDKYMGDSVMAFWGAPWASDTHAADALLASRNIQRKVNKLSAEMQSSGLPEIRIGIGISTGFANVGHMGSRHHMTYTAVGDPVNTANRLQRCTGYYDLSIVVSESTVENAPEYLFRELDTVHVKGRRRFVRLFQPVCLVDEATPDLLKRLQLHRKAMQFYRRGLWDDAQRLFEKLGQDEPVESDFYQKYVTRIQQIRSTRPQDDSAHIVDLTRQVG